MIGGSCLVASVLLAPRGPPARGLGRAGARAAFKKVSMYRVPSSETRASFGP
jgi:hypothetical protein